MKKYLFISVFLSFLFLAGQSFGYEIHFTSPINGQSFLCSSSSTYYVNVMWSSSGELTGHYYYDKLITDSGEYNNKGTNTIPNWIYVGQGSHSWQIELWEGNILGQESRVAYQTITFYVKYVVYAANNFGSGSIVLEGATVPSGSSTNKYVNESVSVGAIDQNDGAGYYRVWNTNGTNNSNWQLNGFDIYGATSRNLSYTVTNNDYGATLTAVLKKVCQATFVKPDGNTTQNVIEGNTASAVTAPSMYTSSDWIYYNFVNWTWSGGSSTNTTITPTLTAHTTYTANYTATTANPQPMNIHFTSTDGQNVSLGWTDHPNVNVTQYQVWRMVEGGSATAIATLNRGTTSFTDGAYIQNPNGAKKLFYTVKAYYSLSGLWNDPGYYLNRGDLSLYSIAHGNNNGLNVVGKETPAEYSLGNYPNPFNPTTTIDYQLPENGFVTIKVYDILGKEVATLVNENKSAGYYKVNFDASRLTSGVYIYTINANGFSQSKKMLLMK